MSTVGDQLELVLGRVPADLADAVSDAALTVEAARLLRQHFGDDLRAEVDLLGLARLIQAARLARQLDGRRDREDE